MKNPHGVKPTRYRKRKESEYAIFCYPDFGPIFGNEYSDIYIGDQYITKNSCSIDHNGVNGYECEPQQKKSLFVNTAGPDERNYFSVLDYEVYTHN